MIADEMANVILPKRAELSDIERRLNLLPGSPPTPEVLTKLHRAFEDCLRPRQVEPRVLALVKHLDTLRDGVGRLNAYSSELSEDAIEAVRTAKTLADTQMRQLIEAGELDAALQDAERRIGEQLSSQKPWVGIDAIAPDLDAARVAYRDSRLAKIGKQEQLAEAARERVKEIPGFEKLDAARETASQTLDELTQENTGVVVVRVNIDVRDRVITSAQDVEALLDEIRTRLLAQLDGEGQKIRLRLS